MIDLGAMTIPERQAALLRAARHALIGLDPAAEADRLAAVAAVRVILAVPRDEYEAARRNALRVMGRV